VDDDRLILQPHPLSPLGPRALKQPQEAEIIGQVVGVAMKIGDWTNPSQQMPTRSKPNELN
jgi:hypothetical protein